MVGTFLPRLFDFHPRSIPISYYHNNIDTADFGYFNGKEYVHKIIETPGEVVSFHGSIASSDPRFHFHASIALMDHGVVGGHLFNAVVSPLMEIQVTRLRGIHLSRKLNEKSGLKEIEIS